jgi:hypothetical protein
MQTAAAGARRATLLRLLELLLRLVSFPQALLARATAGGRARKRSQDTSDRHSSLPTMRSPSPVHSPCHGVTRSASHSGLLVKSVHFNVEQARPFCSNRVVTSRYTLLTFVPASLLSLLKCAACHCSANSPSSHSIVAKALCPPAPSALQPAF